MRDELYHSTYLEFDSSCLEILSNSIELIELIRHQFHTRTEKSNFNECDFLKLYHSFSEDELIIESSSRKTICKWDIENLYFVTRDNNDYVIQAGSWNKFKLIKADSLNTSSPYKRLIYNFLEREVLISFYRKLNYIIFHGALLLKGENKIFLLGKSGSGKSTISRALENLDWECVSDDIFVYSKNTKNFLNFPKKNFIDSKAENIISTIKKAHYAHEKIKKSSRVFIIDFNSSYNESCSKSQLNLADGIIEIASNLVITESQNSGESLISTLLPIFQGSSLHKIKTNHLSINEIIKAIVYE